MIIYEILALEGTYVFARPQYLIKHYRAKRPAPPRINNAVRPEIPVASNPLDDILVIIKVTVIYMRIFGLV